MSGGRAQSCNEESSKILRNLLEGIGYGSWVMSGPRYSVNARSMDFMDLKEESVLSKVFCASHSLKILRCNSSYRHISFFIFS